VNFRTYLARRLLLMIPTFLGITLVNFAFVQLAPGGPIESFIAKVKFSGGGGDGEGGGSVSARAGGGSEGSKSIVTKEVIEELKKRYGFDKPIHERYWIWLRNTLTLEFGYSFAFGQPVIEVIKSKFPVSVRFGVAGFLITYLVCIPLGIFKALKDGTPFDTGSSLVIFILYSVPYYMLAIVLIHLFAGGRYFEFFPLGGLQSLDGENLPFFARLKDQIWHMILPLTCFVVNSFATLTLLMKNSIIEEIGKDYMRTARAKGVSESMAVLKHSLRNALVPLATGIGGVIAVFFTSNLLIERIFNLDGFGKLFFDAALQRDYPLLMAQVALGALIGLMAQLISDVAYIVVDPRINYEKLG
jgi:microcin C transport system permease protein